VMIGAILGRIADGKGVRDGIFMLDDAVNATRDSVRRTARLTRFDQCPSKKAKAGYTSASTERTDKNGPPPLVVSLSRASPRLRPRVARVTRPGCVATDPLAAQDADWTCHRRPDAGPDALVSLWSLSRSGERASWSQSPSSD